MPAISKEAQKLLSRTSLVVFPEDYIAVYLPIGVKTIPGEWFRPATTVFAAVLQESKLVTMILPLRKWLRMQSMFEKYDVSGPLKVINFDVKSSMEAGSFRVAIASILAESGIRSIPISSFKSYHTIVPKADLPRTVKALRKFLESYKKKRAGAAKKSMP
ncbi:MAG: hypothetical protein JXA73_24995 [Acidobacteria bacterium]|nr:hypothetical protein [Acidobacteriota bacterium]